MDTAVRLTALVQPGGKIEVISPELPTGQSVEVIVLVPGLARGQRPSVLDVLAAAPGHLAFTNAAEVDAYVRGECDAWER
jgi:hypothetical protein